MSTKPCAFCGEPAEQVEGRRPRKFCSDTCRQKYWQAKNKLKIAAKEGKTPAVIKQMPVSEKQAKNDPSDIEKQIAEIKADAMRSAHMREHFAPGGKHDQIVAAGGIDTAFEW